MNEYTKLVEVRLYNNFFQVLLKFNFLLIEGDKPTCSPDVATKYLFLHNNSHNNTDIQK